MIGWLLLLLAGCWGGTTGPAVSDADACVTWLDNPMLLSPRKPEPRHHPTVAFLSTGEIIVSWQVGKSPAFVATRTFSPRLQSRTREGRIDDIASRATHPQLAVGPSDVVSMLWSDETSGALAWRPLTAAGDPQGPAVDLRGDGAARPGLYGDLSYGPHGELAATWFVEPARWLAARRVDETWSLSVIPTLPDTNVGGPGTVRHAPDGTAWVAWPERAAADGEGGRATLRAATLGADGLSEPLTLLATPDNAQRLALAFPTGHLAAAWTRYPTRGDTWGAFLGVWQPDGTGPATPQALGGTGARMVDIDALDDTLVAAWEAPANAEQSDLWLQVFTADGTPSCAPMRVHGADELDDTRANLALRRDDDGSVHGVVVWQRGPSASRDAVWGRRFVVGGPR